MLRSIPLSSGALLFVAACISDSPAMAPPTASVAGELLENADFEVSGCAKWQGNSAVISDEPSTVHGGTHACRVCSDSNPDTSVYSVSQRIDVAKLKPGVTYQAGAWVRAPADGATALELHGKLTLDGGDDFTPEVDGMTESQDPMALSSNYHQFFAPGLTYRTTPGGTSIFFGILNRRGDHACFIIDDASFAPQK